MKKYWGVELFLHTFLTSALDWYECYCSVLKMSRAEIAQSV